MVKYLFHKIRATLSRFAQENQLRRQNPTCTLKFPIKITSPKKLELGKRVFIGNGCNFHCGGLAWSNFEGAIKIGDDSAIAEGVLMYGAGGITIGKSNDIGPGVKIFSSRSDYNKLPGPSATNRHLFDEVIIHDQVILFANVVVSPGVTIGEGAVVGAGAVVTQDVLPWSVYHGAPAKFVKKRTID